MSANPMMERRELLARALWLIGAASVPVVSGPALSRAATRATPYLAASAFALLSAVADTVIPRTETPGAVDVGVPAKLDALLVNWASGQRRYELTQSLQRIEALAEVKTGMAFASLSPDQRKDLLVPYDIAAYKAVPDTRKLNPIEALMAGPAVADPGYAKLKELIALLYYYSEEALTGELPYEHSPGGWTPSIKVTPETRAPGGLGMF